MTTIFRSFRQLFGSKSQPAPAVESVATPVKSGEVHFFQADISSNDPLVAYFQSSPGAVEIEKLNLASPALSELKAAGIKLVIPLVSQGELIGLLNLGTRLSEQEYSSEDRSLLNNLAAQAAPALRVAQLVQQQQAEARQRERMENEMRVARIIQQTLLPQVIPTFDGWSLGTHYQPARAVGGDFYDFIELEDGRLAIIIGDVTDKGVPAALVMATTRTILRGATEQFNNPGAILEKANNVLCPDIPRNMFVTCLYAILDHHTGQLVYANAGHDLPYRRGINGVDELRATGMPLGLMPGMHYEEKEIILDPGDSLLLYSDGLVEAHNPAYEMFGFPRLRDLMASKPKDIDEVTFLLDQLTAFTGPDWEQEDDVTLITVERLESTMSANSPDTISSQSEHDHSLPGQARLLAEFSLPSEPGNERLAMERVAGLLESLNLEPARLEKIKTALAEGTMNAIEHGNQNRPELPVKIYLFYSDANRELTIRITDMGGGRDIPQSTHPDLEAKLAGLQSPRGWGLFLIKNMVDDMRVFSDQTHHTLELVFHLQGEGHAN
jgi:serine phosphatase RsbU (regulator of sigma subunit)/anti-sigma regulatory factor (Ser/Thr protein kinase)